MMDTRTVDNKKFRGQSRTRSTESLFFFPCISVETMKIDQNLKKVWEALYTYKLHMTFVCRSTNTVEGEISWHRQH